MAMRMKEEVMVASAEKLSKGLPTAQDIDPPCGHCRDTNKDALGQFTRRRLWVRSRHSGHTQTIINVCNVPGIEKGKHNLAEHTLR